MAKAEQETVEMKTEKHSATEEWIKAHVNYTSLDDESSELESAESSILSSTEYESDDICSCENAEGNIKPLGSQISSSDLSTLTELFEKVNGVQTVGNVNIQSSTQVHIGNITNINGNIQIIHKGRASRHHRRERTRTNDVPDKDSAEVEEREERNPESAFISRAKFKPAKGLCSMIPRHMWVAQCPLEPYDPLQEPVQYVVIMHTATESSEKQSINIRIVRDVQCFHIESRGWNDIAYNFLIGCDGNIYEGRGWGVTGAHTMGYNKMSIGIAFIGCFMRVLPSKKALEACKNLLKRGVDEGHLDSNYRLVCASQCRPTESPGRTLVEEIEKWEHFYRIEEEVDSDEGESP